MYTDLTDSISTSDWRRTVCYDLLPTAPTKRTLHQLAQTKANSYAVQ
ncbi:uncharacterized protein An04g05290 [Aspergillus niger]|uniref:Contig An04c0170, genomic contig n=2 Tax=Aspergillus niger TaxID=5061 RepID=A2QIZ7_ASPNC|nr:uncharacterized protein An04g05290 [Aspergillus niger]CAK38791.1 unnamed protein product [Aspergillus niger]